MCTFETFLVISDNAHLAPNIVCNYIQMSCHGNWFLNNYAECFL